MSTRILRHGPGLWQEDQTDCSISSQVDGKTYCFGSKEAMSEFMKDPKGNLAKADEFFKKG